MIGCLQQSFAKVTLDLDSVDVTISSRLVLSGIDSQSLLPSLLFLYRFVILVSAGSQAFSHSHGNRYMWRHVLTLLSSMGQSVETFL